MFCSLVVPGWWSFPSHFTVSQHSWRASRDSPLCRHVAMVFPIVMTTMVVFARLQWDLFTYLLALFKTLRHKNEILYFLKRYKVSLLSSTKVGVYTRWGALDKVLLIQEVKFSANLIKKCLTMCLFFWFVLYTWVVCEVLEDFFSPVEDHTTRPHTETHTEKCLRLIPTI